MTPSAPFATTARVAALAIGAALAAMAAVAATTAVAATSPRSNATATPVPALSSDQRQAWRLLRWEALPGHSPVVRTPSATNRTLVLDSERLSGPPGLDCAAARTAVVAMPAEGLFQGGLGDTAGQAARTARRLGLGPGPFPTLRIDCDNASLDLHLGPDGLWRLALDGRIAVWQRQAASDSPAVVVQDLLLRHLARPLSRYEGAVAAAARWLHPSLRRDFAGYFAHPWPKDEVPPLDGDPFTDSQEPPDRIEWLTTEFSGSGARQTLRLVFEAGGRRHERLLHYELRRHGGRWRIVDIVSANGEGLADLLRRR